MDRKEEFFTLIVPIVAVPDPPAYLIGRKFLEIVEPLGESESRIAIHPCDGAFQIFFVVVVQRAVDLVESLLGQIETRSGRKACRKDQRNI